MGLSHPQDYYNYKKLLINFSQHYNASNLDNDSHEIRLWQKYFCYRGFIREEVSKLCESEGFKLINKDYTLTFKAN